MSNATCKECGAPLGNSEKCDHGADPRAAAQVPTSARSAAPVGGLAVIPQAAPVVAVEPAAREAAKAEVKAALVKSGIAEPEADAMAESAIAKARGEGA
jgi:hypothetical protein